MKNTIVILSALLALSACGQKQEATTDSAAQQPAATAAQPAAKRDVSTATLVKIDEDIQQYADAVDAAKAAYEAQENEANKTKLFKAYVAFGDYMQYDSNVSPREGKYHRALLEYRNALALNPDDQKVTGEITQIEDIYRSMGRPIPGQE